MAEGTHQRLHCLARGNSRATISLQTDWPQLTDGISQAQEDWVGSRGPAGYDASAAVGAGCLRGQAQLHRLPGLEAGAVKLLH